MTPSLYISLVPGGSIWMVNILQQTRTWSKPSRTDYRHLTPIFYTRGYKPWCHGGTNAWMSVVTT